MSHPVFLLLARWRAEYFLYFFSRVQLPYQRVFVGEIGGQVVWERLWRGLWRRAGETVFDGDRDDHHQARR
jgi:hypothetical protein